MSYAVSDRTRQSLCSSLKALMAEKPLEKITIREITSGCGMNRQAFYYHFADIYDLVRWMFQEEAVALLKQREGVLLWQEGLLQFFRYIKENQIICLCALKSLGRDHLKRFFYAEIYDIIHQTVMDLAHEINYPKDATEAQFITQFYVVALSGILESYLLGELDMSPETLIQFADRMFQDHLRGAALRQNGTSQTLADGKAAD